MEISDGEMKMFLYRKVWSKCYKCGKRGRSWSYRSKCKKYSLHVACVREMVLESWMNNETVPFGRLLVGERSNRKGKEVIKKGCEVALQIVVSAILGDPCSALVAGVVGSFI